MIQVLISTISIVMYIPVCDIVADYLTREFSFKEEGFFNRLVMLCMLLLAAVSVAGYGPIASYIIILLSLTFLTGVYYYDKRKANS